MVRRLLLAVVLCALAGAFGAARAHAAVSCPSPEPQTLSSPHFDLTYQDLHGSNDAVTQSQAQSVLAGAEQAWDKFVAMGFTPPPAGFLPIEIDIVNLTSQNVSAVYCYGGFVFDSASIGTEGGNKVLYSSVFTQFAYARGAFDDWLIEGVSEWAAFKALGFPAFSTSDLGPWDISLDCAPTFDPQGVENPSCSKTQYENDRESFWPFYEYLAEKFGSPAFMQELMDDDSTAPDGITAIQTAMTAHGSSLATEFSNFAGKLLSGGWTAAVLNTASPPASATIQTGAATGDTPEQSVRVGHLASRFLQIDRGDGSASHKCYTATLTVNVTLPSGVSSHPVFYWAAANSTPVPLTVSGSTATATLPWDTCTWSSHGFLSLPNESTSVDDASFAVSTHLVVNSTETTATPPSAPANSYGNSTDPASGQTAFPLISVLGPQTIKLKSTATSLSVVVQSSDQGLLSGSLGGSDLGKQAIVAGTNSIHFKLSASILRKVRAASAAGDKILTLTPLSPDGTVAGAAVTLNVSVSQPTQKLRVKVKKTAKRK